MDYIENENHENWRIRREAYRYTRNWAKAEDDKDYIIRQHAYYKTGNWVKAEDDKDWEIRQQAYLKTGNWVKAKQDLLNRFKKLDLNNVIIYGEAYGGKQQGMRETYGDDLKFIAFDDKKKQIRQEAVEYLKLKENLNVK